MKISIHTAMFLSHWLLGMSFHSCPKVWRSVQFYLGPFLFEVVFKYGEYEMLTDEE